MGVCYQLKEWEDDCRSKLTWMASSSPINTSNSNSSSSNSNITEDCNYIIGGASVSDPDSGVVWIWIQGRKKDLKCYISNLKFFFTFYNIISFNGLLFTSKS